MILVFISIKHEPAQQDITYFDLQLYGNSPIPRPSLLEIVP